MQTYLSMVVIQDELARGLPDHPKMDVQHCPPFGEKSNDTRPGTRPTSQELPKPLSGATAITGGLDTSSDSEDVGLDDDQDKPKPITEIIIKSLSIQKKCLFSSGS